MMEDLSHDLVVPASRHDVVFPPGRSSSTAQKQTQMGFSHIDTFTLDQHHRYRLELVGKIMVAIN